MRAYVFETRFTNGRNNFMDLVVASSAIQAQARATEMARSVCDHLPCDHDVEIAILGELASDPASLAEDMTNANS